MFEKAVRLKLRFNTCRGLATVEDLWDMPLTSKTQNGFSLDDLAKSLHKSIKESEETSFVKKRKDEDNILQLQFDIVKRVIDVKLAEIESKEQSLAKKQKIEKLDQLLIEKEYEHLKSLSKEELQKMRDAL